MDVTRFLPKLVEKPSDEVETATQGGPRGRKSQGPQRFRYVTAGQQRRQMVRDAEAQHRKTNKRYRRRWMANRAATATLRGQLQYVGLLPWADGTMSSHDSEGRIERHLVEAYGSLEDARSRYFDIITESAK
jgi:hypothetical protein